MDQPLPAIQVGPIDQTLYQLVTNYTVTDDALKRATLLVDALQRERGIMIGELSRLYRLVPEQWDAIPDEVKRALVPLPDDHPVTTMLQERGKSTTDPDHSSNGHANTPTLASRVPQKEGSS